jgi:hypothetical protein
MWNQGFPINWQAPLNRGLLSWWLRTPVLVSTARWLDVCEKSHGALTGSVTWSGSARPGGWGAPAFAGTEYITPALPTRFELGVGDWTTAAWIKPTNVSVDRVIWAKCAAAAWESAAKTWYLKASTGLQVLDTYGVVAVNSTSAPTMGAWSHVAVSFLNSSNAVVFYLNGRADGSTTYALTADNAAHVLRFGALTSGLEIPWIGAMDDLRFYNRVLSAEEILRLYHASRMGYQQELHWLEDDDYRHAVMEGWRQMRTPLLPARVAWAGVEY